MQKCEFPSETEQRNSPSEPIVSALENTQLRAQAQAYAGKMVL